MSKHVEKEQMIKMIEGYFSLFAFNFGACLIKKKGSIDVEASTFIEKMRRTANDTLKDLRQSCVSKHLGDEKFIIPDEDKVLAKEMTSTSSFNDKRIKNLFEINKVVEKSLKSLAKTGKMPKEYNPFNFLDKIVGDKDAVDFMFRSIQGNDFIANNLKFLATNNTAEEGILDMIKFILIKIIIESNDTIEVLSLRKLAIVGSLLFENVKMLIEDHVFFNATMGVGEEGLNNHLDVVGTVIKGFIMLTTVLNKVPEMLD